MLCVRCILCLGVHTHAWDDSMASYAMLCYVTLRYAMLRHAMLCYAMLCWSAATQPNSLADRREGERMGFEDFKQRATAEMASSLDNLHY